MLTNILLCSWTFYNCAKFASFMLPYKYKKLDEAQNHSQENEIKEKISNILNSAFENTEYKEMIQDNLDELQDGKKTINYFVETKIKIVSKESSNPSLQGLDIIGSTGTSQGKYYIILPSKINENLQKALPWVLSHELAHVLEEDWLQFQLIKTIIVFSSTVFCIYKKINFIPATIGIITLNVISQIYLHHKAENKADHLANSICKKDDLESAKKLLNYFESNSVGSGIKYKLKNIYRLFTHPLTKNRVANIDISIKKLSEVKI